MIFSIDEIEKISNLLNTKPQEHQSGNTWYIKNDELNDKLVLTLYNNVINVEGEITNLVSVLTQLGTIELHNVSGFMLFEPDEIIFVSSYEGKVSSLIVGKKGTASIYANINKTLINADITGLDTAFILSAMQLSLTETII